MKNELAELLVNQLEAEISRNEIMDLIEIPPDEKLGDYALPCFSLAKRLRKSPLDIAQDLAQGISTASIIADVHAVAGYLNVFINRDILASRVMQAVLNPAFGRGHARGTTVVEYCSPSTNKPLHLGHLRNMAIGESVSRILEFMGSTVVTL